MQSSQTPVLDSVTLSLQDWRNHALSVEQQVGNAVVGQERAIRLLLVAVFARGHVMLEGNVGVGKTTLLRAIARAIGGGYARVEGTIDLMPSDLVYYTYVDEDGKPRVAPGPLLQHGDALSIFFFNEVNRARPQMHSLMLRVMAERSVSAFNRDYQFPHLQVFADRNRVEREETFEIPAAARDRFLMELEIAAPQDPELQRELMFNPRFHDTDQLLDSVANGVVAYQQLNDIAAEIQNRVHASLPLQQYVLDLCRATGEPAAFGIQISDVDVGHLVQSGVSPRGTSLLLRAARVTAWLNGRDMVLPEDIHEIFFETIAHRIFFKPVYELRRAELASELIEQIRQQVSAP